VLFHEYRVDDHGLLNYVNLIIASGQNNRAMNHTVRQIARHYLRGGKLEEGLLNRWSTASAAMTPVSPVPPIALGKMPCGWSCTARTVGCWTASAAVPELYLQHPATALCCSG